GTLNIHRLVQAVARERMGAKRQEKWGKAAIELLIATLPDGTRLHKWVDGPQMLPHMIAAAELGAQFNWETERLALLCNETGYYLQHLGDYKAARPFYEQALAINQKVLGEAHPDTASSLNNMGALLRAMGQLAEARPFYEQALAIRQKVLGDAHPDTARSLNNLAVLAYDEQDMPEAARLMRQALAIWEKVLGKDHPSTQSSRESLATIEAALG
ncbi:hypothetical protein MNBD_CHLOROFLEXI01-3218, partial [hydrothermal vent metagenome]